MNRNIIIGIVVVVIVLLGGTYILSQSGSQPAPAADNSEEAMDSNNDAMMEEDKMGDDTMMEGGLVMMGEDPNLGSFVQAANDMTLYTFDKDTGSVSNCYDTCATNWPPYLVEGEVPATLPEHLGTTERNDGTVQYTWDGAPLYFYIGDKNVGDVTGDGVGGVWHIAK